MDKKIFINILIGKEDEDLLGKMDKKELKKLEKLFESCKGVLDRLGKKETTDQDIKDFIKLIDIREFSVNCGGNKMEKKLKKL